MNEEQRMMDERLVNKIGELLDELERARLEIQEKQGPILNYALFNGAHKYEAFNAIEDIQDRLKELEKFIFETRDILEFLKARF